MSNATEKRDTKSNGKKKIIIFLTITALIICGIIVTFTIIAGNKNKQVDASAAECMEVISSVEMDLSNPAVVDKNQAFANFVELSTFANSEKINEDSLTYFDGSKNKYNEVNEKYTNIFNSYKNYFVGQNENIFNGADVDVNNASKEELNSAYNQLTALSADMELTINSTIWNQDTAWSMLWGNSADESKANYSEFKTKVDNKIAEIKSRLDAIAQEEASAAASATQSQKQSSSAKSSGGQSYSGSNSGGNTGGNSSGSGEHNPYQYGTWEWFEWTMSHGGHRLEPLK